MIHTITMDNFDALVLRNDKPVLVDFWASWCMPCRMLSPLVDEVAEELEGKCVTAKLNVDDCQELAVKYGVMSIPTLMVFENGQMKEKMIGVQSKDAILAMMERYLA